MATSVLGLLTSDLQKEIDVRAASLAEGSAKDYAEYKGMCGVVEGLAIAQRFVAEAVQRHRTADDE